MYGIYLAFTLMKESETPNGIGHKTEALLLFGPSVRNLWLRELLPAGRLIRVSHIHLANLFSISYINDRRCVP
jgi:hypothetical protein